MNDIEKTKAEESKNVAITLYNQSTKSNSYNGFNLPIPDDAPGIYFGKWVLSKTPLRKCGTPLHLTQKSDGTRQIFISLLCRSWNCAICGPFLKETWYDHLEKITINLEDLYMMEVPASAIWKTIATRIHRAGGQFIRIELENGSYVVLNTGAQGELLPKMAIEPVLKAGINGATFRRRPIHTSRKWALKTIQSESKFKLVNILTTTLKEVREELQRMGLSPEYSPSFANTGYFVKIPASWVNENDGEGFKRFARRLDSLGK